MAVGPQPPIPSRQEVARQFLSASRHLEAAPEGRPAALVALASCVRAEPGNPLFVDAFLRHTQAAHNPYRFRWPWHVRRMWHRWRARRRLWRALQSGAARRALELAPEALLAGAAPSALLSQLAGVCESLEYREAARRYWQAAWEAGGGSAAAGHGYARSLLAAGLIAEAAPIWCELQRRFPRDEDARRMVRLLSAPYASGPPAGGSTLGAGTPPSLAELEAAEDVARNAAQLQYHEAELRAAELPSAEAESWLRHQRAVRDQAELDYFARRADRYPRESAWKLQLARQLESLKRFPEALECVEEICRVEPENAPAALARGEYLQRMRRFAEALAAYCEAQASAVATGRTDIQRRALHRASVLAEALGLTDQARTALNSLLAIDPQDGVAQSRLDRLP